MPGPCPPSYTYKRWTFVRGEAPFVGTFSCIQCLPLSRSEAASSVSEKTLLLPVAEISNPPKKGRSSGGMTPHPQTKKELLRSQEEQPLPGSSDHLFCAQTRPEMIRASHFPGGELPAADQLSKLLNDHGYPLFLSPGESQPSWCHHGQLFAGMCHRRVLPAVATVAALASIS